MGSVIIHVKLLVSWQNDAMSGDGSKLIVMTVFLPLDEENMEEKLRKPHMLLFPQ